MVVCVAAFALNAVPLRAQEKQEFKVSVAVLSLPSSKDGLIHWRALADTQTTPLQLSKRYFSEHLKLPSNVIAFYDAPVAAKQTEPPPPEPFHRVTIPAGSKLTYIVLWADKDANQKIKWQSKLITAEEWPDDSMKLLNITSETLGIMANEKPIKLEAGKNINFLARDWDKSFPVKIYSAKNKDKPIFSSTWRISAGRRELCLLSVVNGAVNLKSLMDLAPKPPPAPETIPNPQP